METTREGAREDSHKNLVHNLQELLQKNYDAEKGFRKAVKDSDNHELKEFLKRQAVQHNRFATELDSEIRSLNETPKDNSSGTGGLHRAWIDIKTAISGNDDEAVLEECIRGEKACAKEYEERLKENNFPANIQTKLNSQLNDIQTTISRVKRLEDLADAKD